MNMRNDSDSESCYNFSKTQFDVAFRVKITMDSLGILMCLIVLAVIVLFKAYKRLVFRLVFYFIVANMFQAITHIIELTPIEHMNGGVNVRRGADGLCAFFGFLDQVALWMCNVAIIWIMLYLLWKVLRVQKGINPTKDKISKKTELIGIFFLLFFPLTFNWIPFTLDMYGISGLWCWIKETKDCYDYTLGLTLIFTLFYGPLIIIITFFFASLIAITSILCKGALNGSADTRGTYIRCIKHTILITIYPLIYNLICLFPIANRISSASRSNSGNPIFFLWMAHTLAEPARVLIPPIAFLLHPSSWKTLIRIRRNTVMESSRTPSLSLSAEDSDMGQRIAIRTTSDPKQKAELYGTMIMLSDTAQE